MSYLRYLLFRALTFPLAFLSYPALHALGRGMGTAVYYLYPRYRKRAVTNLALAHIPPAEIKKLAIASLQNLSITLLEYPKLAREKEISRIAHCENPDKAAELLNSGKGVIFFCGHQANWEILFLEGTSRMPGVAIGRPIDNPFLYKWVIAIREKFGGKIVPPQNAFKEGLRGLKRGAFVGVVGDQGRPNSGFSCPFFGRLAWTSPLPALLSLRTGAPIIVASVRREKGKYFIHYSDPIFPENHTVDSLMEKTLALFEASVRQNPGQWLWTHNRWKQQPQGKLPRRFRHESIALVFPNDASFLEVIPALRTVYPTEFFTAYIPEHLPFSHENIEVKTYRTLDDLLTSTDRYKLVFDFASNRKIRSHFFKQGAFEVFNLSPNQLLEKLYAR